MYMQGVGAEVGVSADMIWVQTGLLTEVPSDLKMDLAQWGE